MTFEPVRACRSCGGGTLFEVLDLGEQPLANAFVADGSTLPRYPLAIVCCSECSLVQLTGTVPPHELFDEYAYFSSYSDTMVAAMRALAGRLARERGLESDDLAVDVASNDGYLLRHYADEGIRVLGIEPAANVAAAAEERGVPTLVEYLTAETGRRVREQHGPAAIVHANNVLAHVPDVNDFVAGLAALVADDGVVVVETPYLVRLVERAEFDTIYHEHVFYYSLTAVEALAARHGLSLHDVEELPLHGGSLRLFFSRGEATPTEAVERLRHAERALRVSEPGFYAGFARRVEDVRDRTSELLTRLHAEGRPVAAYGAAAKGTVLLNHLGADVPLVQFVADRNEHKQGKTVPGTRIPVLAPAAIDERRPDYVLLLVWNLRDEVLAQQQEYRRRGGKFIIPIPELEVV